MPKLLKTKVMKTLIQRILFGYKPNPKATAPRSGSRLTQPGEQLTFNERFNYLKSQWQQQLEK